MTTKVKIIRVNKTLRHKYDGQSQPQPCYVELDCETEWMSADWNAEVGNAVPERVRHARAVRWRIETLPAREANKLLTALRPLSQRVVDGFERRWNGSNHVGSFTDAADAALTEIHRHCERA